MLLRRSFEWTFIDAGATLQGEISSRPEKDLERLEASPRVLVSDTATEEQIEEVATEPCGRSVEQCPVL